MRNLFYFSYSQIQRRVRRIETRWTGSAMHICRFTMQSSQESLHEYFAVRSFSFQIATSWRWRRIRLHQCQLCAGMNIFLNMSPEQNRFNFGILQGHNSPREFIVTQGPLHSTRDDFWRMCWESNSRAIVMLTRCFEKGREKCDQYWPNDTMPVYYGDIMVQILNDSKYPDWSTTEFMICRATEQRRIRHFHFTTWPDFGVPNPPQTLARFVRAFRGLVQPDQRPIVVHCSAGVGRSGTFITLDRILQQIKVSNTVDIFGIVWAMRKGKGKPAKSYATNRIELTPFFITVYKT